MRALHVVLCVLSLTRFVDAAPPAREMSAVEVNKWIGFFDRLVVTVVKAQTTCEKLAFDVARMIDANQDAVEVARNARAEGRRLPDAAQQHMRDGVMKMVPAMQKCGQHEKVRAAFAKLDLDRKR